MAQSGGGGGWGLKTLFLFIVFKRVGGGGSPSNSAGPGKVPLSGPSHHFYNESLSQTIL